MSILTLNAGSSSIKYKLFTDHLSVFASGLIENIGESAGFWHHTEEIKSGISHTFATHEEAFTALSTKLKTITQTDPVGRVGHRVVHGADQYTKPTLINNDVYRALEKLNPLAPLHNPVNLAGIRYARQHFPHARHIALFDTAFHHAMPDHVRYYAINKKIAENFHIKRYGFHGINHEYITRSAAQCLGKAVSQVNLISLHLGNGASACLVQKGISTHTTMGFTPLAGLVMGTRSGNIDPAIPLYLIQSGMTAESVYDLLNKKSGLLGLAGDNDMRHVLMARDQGSLDAKLALDIYIDAIQQTIGAYYALCPQLDALVFTGGVGENAASIRESVLKPLAHFGFALDLQKNNHLTHDLANIALTGLPIYVIRGDEERMIAETVQTY